MTSRNYCFTTFNTKLEIENSFENGGIRYIVWQLELCDTTDRLHLQGYMELYKPMRVSGVKKLFGDATMHLETRRGSRDDARNYCRKEKTRIDGYWELGEWTAGGQGARNDITKFVKNMNEKNLDYAIEEDPVTYVKFHKGLEKLKEKSYPKRNWKMEVIYCVGDPGIGKTRWVYDNYDSDDIYVKPDGKWWSGYEGQQIVLLDDYEGEIPWAEFLKLLDRYPHKVELKGKDHVEFHSKTIVITSNYPYWKWYPDKKRVLYALERRFTKSIKM